MARPAFAGAGGARPAADTGSRTRNTVQLARADASRQYLPRSFSGTGALCLEALSRGAAHATLVEQAAPVVETLRRNIETLKAHNAEVRRADAVEFLQGPVTPVDILFLDPPFASDLIGRCAELIEARGWVKPGGLIYIEAPHRLMPLPIPSRWDLIRSKVAGQVGYHLARRVASSK